MATSVTAQSDKVDLPNGGSGSRVALNNDMLPDAMETSQDLMVAPEVQSCSRQ